MTSKLWAIYIPGPDEYYAAPDEKSAIEMMEKHNAAITKYIAEKKADWADLPTKCEVAEWPGSKEDHAAEILDFDYVAWEIERSGA